LKGDLPRSFWLAGIHFCICPTKRPHNVNGKNDSGLILEEEMDEKNTFFALMVL
jgi:hypothetical protein